MNSDPVFIPENAIYTPQESVAMAVEGIKRAKDGQAQGLRFDFGYKPMNDYIAPLGPAQLMFITAQTSNYKSGLMRFIEYTWAKQLEEEGRTDECIIHISLEEVVEEQVNYQFERYSGERAGALARGHVMDWDRLLNAATIVGKIPIYRIGDSLARPEEYSQLHLRNIYTVIRKLTNGDLGFKIKPAAICLDYLQALPPDPDIRKMGEDQQRRLQVRRDVYTFRDMGKFLRCAALANVQAKQTLEGTERGSTWKLPGIYDGAEAKEVAERPDRYWTCWMPKMTSPVGTEIDHGGFSFNVAENTLFIKVAKQRGGLPSGQIFPCFINFETGNVFYDTNFTMKGGVIK
jgi:hypothetical protein